MITLTHDCTSDVHVLKLGCGEVLFCPYFEVTALFLGLYTKLDLNCVRKMLMQTIPGRHPYSYQSPPETLHRADYMPVHPIERHHHSDRSSSSGARYENYHQGFDAFEQDV